MTANSQVMPKIKRTAEFDGRKCKIELKNVKEWESFDGGGYTCKIYLDGKLAAECYNDGNGGGNAYDFKSDELKAKVYAYVESLPACTPCTYFPEGLERNLDIVIDEVINWKSLQKQLKRWSKNAVVYQMIDASIVDPLPTGDSWKTISNKDLTAEKRESLKQLVRERCGPGQKVLFAEDLL